MQQAYVSTNDPNASQLPFVDDGVVVLPSLVPRERIFDLRYVGKHAEVEFDANTGVVSVTGTNLDDQIRVFDVGENQVRVSVGSPVGRWDYDFNRPEVSQIAFKASRAQSFYEPFPVWRMAEAVEAEALGNSASLAVPSKRKQYFTENRV